MSVCTSVHESLDALMRALLSPARSSAYSARVYPDITDTDAAPATSTIAGTKGSTPQRVRRFVHSERQLDLLDLEDEGFVLVRARCKQAACTPPARRLHAAY